VRMFTVAPERADADDGGLKHDLVEIGYQSRVGRLLG
jgi:hypothetical protein